MKTNELKKISRRFTRSIFVVQAVTFFFLVLVMIFSSYMHKSDLADQVARSIEGKIKRADKREVINLLSDAVANDFAAAELYDHVGQHVVTFPNQFRRETGHLTKVYRAIFLVPYRKQVFYDRDEKDAAATIVFHFGVFGLLPFALGIFLLGLLATSPFFRRYKNLLVQSFEKDSVEKQNQVITELAKQVRHDYKSPLTAIKSVIDKSKNLSDQERRALTVSYNSMMSMLSDLSNESIQEAMRVGHLKKKVKSLTHIYSTLRDVFDEKLARLEYGSQKQIQLVCSDDDKRGYILIDETELRRVISNVTENALDALDSSGQVIMQVDITGTELTIRISDNGKGISKDNLEKIGEKGFTFGKVGGEGLGLYSAIKKVERWGGQLKIESEDGKGTEVLISLPKAVKPTWSKAEVDFSDIETAVVLDDDKAVHELWKERVPSDVSLKCFEDGEELLDLVDRKDDKVLYILDFNLKGQRYNGLQVAEKLGHAKRKYMVSGSFHDPMVQRQCKAMGLGLIPKTIL